MKRYLGAILENGDRIVTITRDEALVGELPWRLDVRNHSPSGFAWGYGGSGPAQLSLALCIDALDGDVERARGIYQWFKWRIVSHLAQDRDWELTQAFILSTIEALEAERDTRVGVEQPSPSF